MLSHLLGLPVLAFVVALVVYDLVAIRPYLAEIKAILAAADPQDADPPALVRNYIDADNCFTEVQIVRLLRFRLHPEWRHAHAREIAWHVLLPLHFEDRQIHGLFATLVYNGTDHGLGRFAQREFGKALDELSPREIATIVAMTRSPGIYRRDPERLARRVAILLAQEGASPLCDAW